MQNNQYKKPFPWHILVFLLPALFIYAAVMVYPLIETLRLSFFTTQGTNTVFIGLKNYSELFFNSFFSAQFWNALKNNIIFFIIHMCVQNPIGIILAALLSMPNLRGATFYRTAIFIPTMLSVVVIGFAWKLILSNNWGVIKEIMTMVGLKEFYSAKFLGSLFDEEKGLYTLSLISVWQYVGIPMMLIYAALISIPDEILEAADCDGIVGINQFFKVKLPLIFPTLGIVSILTFVGNFNAFDLIYSVKGALAGNNYSADILGTFMYRTFYGMQNQPGDIHLGAAVATIMFLIILCGVGIYLFFVQRKLRRYQF